MTAPTLVISLFGPLRVEVAGEPVELRGSKPPGVLAMLALDPGTPVHADRLVDGLWDHDATGDVHQSLRVHVSVIRRALDESMREVPAEEVAADAPEILGSASTMRKCFAPSAGCRSRTPRC